MNTQQKICFGLGMLLVFLSGSAAWAEPLQVVVSIPPQIEFVQRIGGDFVEVMSMLPEGGFPHTFEPTPQQMTQLSNADMYVRIHVEFEDAWWQKIVTANPEMHIVDSTEGIDFIYTEDDDHDDADHAHGETDHAHHGRDPHVWLSPRLVKIQAEAIYQGLAHLDPHHQDEYHSKTDAFIQALDGLDAEIQTLFADVERQKFMIFHPSWGYFARDYGLQQIPIEMEGKEPSAAEMIQIIKTATQEQIRTIFVQPQTSRRSVNTVAEQIGAEVKVLNPLAPDWMENLHQVAETLATALHDER